MKYTKQGYCGYCLGFQLEYGEDALPERSWICKCRTEECCGNCKHYLTSNIAGDGFCAIGHDPDQKYMDTPFNDICHNHELKEDE